MVGVAARLAPENRLALTVPGGHVAAHAAPLRREPRICEHGRGPGCLGFPGYPLPGKTQQDAAVAAADAADARFVLEFPPQVAPVVTPLAQDEMNSEGGPTYIETSAFGLGWDS